MLNAKDVLKEFLRIDKSKSFFNKLAICLPGMALKEITALEKKNKCFLPDSLKEHFSNFGQTALRWQKLNAENRIITGSMQITAARNLLNNPGNTDFLNAQFMLAPRPLFDSPDLANGFGIFDHVGMGVYTLIKKQDNHFLDELHLFVAPSDFYKLTLKPVEYIEHAYRFRGLFLWQQYFMSEDAAKNRIYPDDLDKNFSFCFPESELPAFTGSVHTAVHAPEPPIIKNLAELKAAKRKGFKLPKLRLEEGASAATLFRAEKSAGMALPDSLSAFYQFADGLEIYWEQGVLSGGFVLTPLRNMMGGGDHNLINGANMKFAWNQDELFNGIVSMPEVQLPETVRFLNTWRPFINVSYAQDRVLIRADKTTGNWQLAITDSRTYFYELKVPVDLFLEITQTLNGVHYWFWIFVLPLRKEKINDFTIMEIIEQLFPDFDTKTIPESLLTTEKSPVVFGS